MKFRTLLVACAWMVATSMQAHSDGHGNYVHSNIFENLKTGEKVALLMVHFGTTHDDTRALTIDALNQKAREAFPDVEVREAYTSRIVMRRLAQRGVQKDNPAEALKRLAAEGYTRVVVQSTNIIDGVEMEALREDIASVRDMFEETRLGNPLLYEPEDYRRVIDILTRKGQAGAATLLVGHGTYTPATAQYAMLDYMLRAEGHEDFLVTTIEGYPTLDDALRFLPPSTRDVQLLPFMFVAGDHAKNDIATDLRAALEARGYRVSVRLEGLGQDPDIQALLIDHARFMTNHKRVGISEKKRAYAAGKTVGE